jgi:hypothetical protein
MLARDGPFAAGADRFVAKAPQLFDAFFGTHAYIAL